MWELYFALLAIGVSEDGACIVCATARDYDLQWSADYLRVRAMCA